jgi:hypothetical protein
MAILEARVPQDIFGELPADPNEALAAASRLYRRLARETHPDVAAGDAAAFSRLSDLWELARKLIAAGEYGKPGLAGRTVKAKARQYVIEERLWQGSIADIHRCSHGLMRIAHRPRDNDLLRAEAMTLRRVRKSTKDELQVYLPDLIDSFAIRDAGSKERQANVFRPLLANDPRNADSWFNLAQLARMFSTGVDPRDAAWIWRRMLICIGIAHDAGYVHHAALPTGFMIQPPEHGVVLMDWSFAVERGAKPLAILPEYRAWYPDEVAERGASNPATDIYMAALCAIRLMGGDPQKRLLPERVPRQIRAYFRACTLISVRKRPDDARRLLESFDDIIHRVWGPRAFRPFPLPKENR